MTRTRMRLPPWSIVLLVGGLAGCHAREVARAEVDMCAGNEACPTPWTACRPGSTCVLRGRLTLSQGEPAWAAVLEDGEHCAKLALPDDFYARTQAWRGSEVIVIGQAFLQPDGDATQVLMWYSHEGRKVSMGACDHGVEIFVDRMVGTRGRRWPR